MAKMKYWNGTTWETLDAKDADTLDGKHAETELTTTEKNDLAGAINEVKSLVESHLADKANPHGVTKTQIGLSNVDNVKQMPISGGTFTGIVKAYSNTSYTVAQIRNIILSTDDADVSAMQDGDIWIKYK